MLTWGLLFFSITVGGCWKFCDCQTESFGNRRKTTITVPMALSFPLFSSFAFQSMTSYRTISKSVFFCAICLYCSLVFPADLSFDQAINIIRGLEKQVDTLYWKASIEQKYYGFDSTVTMHGELRVEAFFDPSRKFYNVSYTTFPPDVVKNDSSAVVDQLAFGGGQYTFLAPNRKLGGITNDRMDFPSSRLFSGLVFAPEGLLPGLPNVFSLMASIDSDGRADLLSSFLSGWKAGKNQFSINEEGVLSVFAEVKLEKTTDCPASVSLLYDTQKGGIITHAVVKYRQLDENGIEQEKELCNWTVETKKNNEGLWVPLKTSYKEFLSSDRLSTTLEATFEVVEINPSIKSDQFVLSMPDGYYVDDFTQKMRYKVGTPFDVDEAVEDFMRAKGLTGNVPPQVRRGNTLRYILMGTGILLIAIGLYQKIQQWRRRK